MSRHAKLKKMHPGAKSNGRVMTRPAFGLMLCVLLMLFAVANKTAGYHRHTSRVGGLTHTKVWQNNQDAAAVCTPDLQLDMMFALALLLTTPLLRFVEIRRDERPAFAAAWFVPTLAVRPPPTR